MFAKVSHVADCCDFSFEVSSGPDISILGLLSSDVATEVAETADTVGIFGPFCGVLVAKGV